MLRCGEVSESPMMRQAFSSAFCGSRGSCGPKPASPAGSTPAEAPPSGQPAGAATRNQSLLLGLALVLIGLVILANNIGFVRWDVFWPAVLIVFGVVLLARNVTLAATPRLVGKDGLKVVLDTGTGSLDALGWGFAHRAAEFQAGSKVDIAFRLERDEYRGESYLQARIADIRLCE